MSAIVRLCVTAVSTAAGALLAAQTPQLVADINRQPDSSVRSSNPGLLGAANGRVFFYADHPLHGGEVWSSDGTAGSTALTRDIRPGGSHSGSWDSVFEHQGFAWFRADDGVHGLELWRSDGSTAGTQLVVDLNPGRASSYVTPVASLGALLLFTARNASNVWELWSTDGTPAGTRQLSVPANPLAFAVDGGRCWFLAMSATALEIWSTDGVSTNRAASIVGPRIPFGGVLVAAGGQLFFPGIDATNGHKLWVSDGTVAGTRPTSLPYGEILTALGTGVVFVAGETLWRTDGTAAGTFQLTNATATRQRLVAHGAELYFTARTPGAGNELWKTDGTVLGTVQVADLTPGPADTSIGAMASAGQELRFLLASPQSALWRTDGSAAGTQSIAFTQNATAIMRVPGTDRTVFVQEDPVVGTEPWVSDGTAAGTRLLLDVWPTPQSQGCAPNAFVDFFGATLMSVSDGIAGQEPWRTDGTAAGTRMLADLNPGPAGSRPREHVVTSDRAFFIADDGMMPPTISLYHTDGTTVSRVALPQPVREGGPTVSEIAPGVVVALIGTADTTDLWRSDGTAGGTYALRTGMSTFPWARGAVLGSGRGRALVMVRRFPGFDLLVTDGTVAGTAPLMSLPEPGQGRGWVGDIAWFQVGVDLWRSDGTTAGTALVARAVPDALLTHDSVFFITGNQLFVARSGQGNVLGSLPEASWFLDPLPGLALIAASNPLSPGWELWRSDGTPNGTQRFAVGNGVVGGVTGAGSRRSLFTVAAQFREPVVLWETDGTTAGTRPLLNWSGTPVAALSDGRLLLTMDDGVRGTELWRLDLGGVAQAVGVGCGDGAPALASDDPVLGQTVRVTGSGAVAPPALAVLLIGGDAQSALPVFPPAPCLVYVDPMQPMVSLAFSPTAATWDRFLPIPGDASLAGHALRLQAAWGPTGSVTGIDLTNGVTWRFGR